MLSESLRILSLHVLVFASVSCFARCDPLRKGVNSVAWKESRMGLFSRMLCTGMMPSAIAKEMVVSSACDPLDFAIWPRMMSKVLEMPRARTSRCAPKC